MHNSTRSAFSENSAKLTPSPSQVAPRGSGEPGHTAVIGVIGWSETHPLSPPPIQAFEGRLQRGTTFDQGPMDSRVRENDAGDGRTGAPPCAAESWRRTAIGVSRLVGLGSPRSALEKVRRAFLAAKPERERKRQRNRGEQDQESLANDVAQTQMVDRDHSHKDDDRVHRESAEKRGVGHVQAFAVRRHRHADETREVSAECENNDGDNQFGNEQHDSNYELGVSDPGNAFLVYDQLRK